MSWDSTSPVDSTLIADIPSSIRSVQAAILADSTMSASDSLTPVTEKAITQYITGTAITMSNKTISSPVLITPQIDDSNSSHQYIVGVADLSADISTAYPLLSANDTFVFDNHAATLKNKTISTPVIEGTISTISIISAAASTDNDVANKKYVDDQDSADHPTYAGGQSHTDGSGLITKLGSTGSIASTASSTVTFGTAFPGGIVAVTITRIESSVANSFGASVGNVGASSFKIFANGARAGAYYWTAVGS